MGLMMEAVEKQNVAGIAGVGTGTGGVTEACTFTRDDPEFGSFLWFVAGRRIQEVAQTYVALAEKAADKGVIEFFFMMADLKNREAEQLEKNAENGCPMPSNEGGLIVSALHSNETVSEEAGSVEEACRVALRLEVANYCLHIHLAELEKNVKTRELFLLLAQMHKATLLFIEKQLNAVAGSRQKEAGAGKPGELKHH